MWKVGLIRVSLRAGGNASVNLLILMVALCEDKLLS